MTFLRWNRLLALGAGLLVLACGGSDGGGGTGPCTPGPATQLAKNGGDAQSWYVNNPLPTPLSVIVRDANNCPVPGVGIDWSVVTGGGGLSPTHSTTNSAGIATTVDSVGAVSPQVVRAGSGTLPSQDFTATAAAPPTSAAVDVKDNFFSPRTVDIQEGGTVTWTFAGAAVHTVTFTGGPDSGTPQVSGTFGPVTFTPAGTKNYFCKVHGSMTGTIRVVH